MNIEDTTPTAQANDLITASGAKRKEGSQSHLDSTMNTEPFEPTQSVHTPAQSQGAMRESSQQAYPSQNYEGTDFRGTKQPVQQYNQSAFNSQGGPQSQPSRGPQ